MGRQVLPEVWKGSRGPPNVPGGDWGGARRPFLRAGRGQDAQVQVRKPHPVVQEGLGGLSGGLDGPPGFQGRFGKPT